MFSPFWFWLYLSVGLSFISMSLNPCMYIARSVSTLFSRSFINSDSFPFCQMLTSIESLSCLQCSVNFASVSTKNFLTRWRFIVHGWNFSHSSTVWSYLIWEDTVFTISIATAALLAAFVIESWRNLALILNFGIRSSLHKLTFSFRSFTIDFADLVPCLLRSIRFFTKALK